MDSISGEKVLDSLFDGVYFVDRERNIVYWNRGAERISGYTRDQMIGSRCADNLLRHIDEQGRPLCNDGCPLAATIADGQAREAQVYLHHRLGHRVPVAARTSPVRDDRGGIVGAVEIFSDNSSSQQILLEYERLKHEAYQDQLTGIANRRYGEMLLATRVYDLKTHGIPFGVLFIDIDHFKQFNDHYGHKTGDDVLIMAAASISHSLRKMDVATRWGGEEFLVVLPGADREVVQRVAGRIRLLIEHSFIMAGSERLSVTVSIGATLSVPGDSADSIVGRADRLMYLSKKGGRNRITCDPAPPSPAE